MRCLCCNKELKNKTDYWHKSCIKSFFGTDTFPKIEITSSNNMLRQYAEDLIENKDSITGVQRKLSLHLSKENNDHRLTLVGYPSGYIFKPESEEYPFIARGEHLVMTMANECDIKTPLHGLIILQDNSYGYITKRMDRKDNDKIHMEDFCQLLEKPTEYKYNSSYERIAKAIDKYSSFPLFDKVDFVYRTIFNFIVGNSDMHLKNFSLIEEKTKSYLSPAYDLLPVNIIVDDEEEVALTLNGKKKNITKNDFINFGNTIGVGKEIMIKLINKLLSKEERLINLIYDSLLEEDIKIKYISLIKSRIERLK